jgi:hypothetical protein
MAAMEPRLMIAYLTSSKLTRKFAALVVGPPEGR